MVMFLGRRTVAFWRKIQIFWTVTVWHWGNGSTYSEGNTAFKMAGTIYPMTEGNTPEHMNHKHCEYLNLATQYLYTCQNYLNGKNNVPKTGKIPDRHVRYNPLLCQSHHLGAEHTIKGIMEDQTPLLGSSWGHKELRGTTASYTPLQSSPDKLASRSALSLQHVVYLRVTCTQQDSERNSTQKTISSKYWVVLSPIRCHVSMHQLEVKSVSFHRTATWTKHDICTVTIKVST